MRACRLFGLSEGVDECKGDYARADHAQVVFRPRPFFHYPRAQFQIPCSIAGSRVLAQSCFGLESSTDKGIDAKTLADVIGEAFTVFREQAKKRDLRSLMRD